MKTTLLFKQQSYRFYFLLVFCLGLNFGWSQQVIGEFPIMDGGLEGQTAGNLASQGSGAKDTPSPTWSISTTGGTTDESILDTPSDARSGNFSVQAQLNNDKDNARLQAPSTVSPNTMTVSTEYTVQFFYKSSEALPDENLKPGVYLNNTSGGKTTNKTDVGSFVANTWVKTYGTVTTGDTFNASNWAVARIGGEKNVDKPLIHFDDFVVYSGAYDDTAPDAATGGTYANNGGTASVGWTAPASGVDGGGYVVVKYTSMPSADNDPNQNGIYQVGNTTTNGTGSLEGTIVYIGTDTSFDEAYAAGNYYKIYTVDKAFNYSSELVVSDATLGLDKNVLSHSVKVYPNPANDVITITTKNIDITSISLYSVLGEQVLSGLALKNDRLNISELSRGVYFMKINSDQGSVTKRIIKK
ncbi:T9SS type A sorting domain-containing protein [Cognatitamlana onchidii]|uniref:T9SS type A sorting domain-containing protein n=1 Tax=Cognatitamlana onchidii TaxID=2562860 RepID=UPI0010A696DC|nr:T9SS type A sorting domain-containing protein [Algibacter onchidii]